MNDWLRQQISAAGSLIPAITNAALDQNQINTPLETAQKGTITKQQQEINQQKKELEAQSKANTGLAKLGLYLGAANSRQQELLNQGEEQNAALTLANKKAESNGIRNTILGVLGSALVANAAAPVAFIPQLDFIPNAPPAEVQHTAQKATLPTLSENVSGALEGKYPGYPTLPQAHRQYIEQHVLSQSGSVNDVNGYPHSLKSVQDTALKQGKLGQVTLSIPNQGDIHNMLSFTFGNAENLNKTVPPYAMTQEQLTKTLNGN
ncbi:MAG: hypothetical protein ACKO3R_07370 [bacterium]